MTSLLALVAAVTPSASVLGPFLCPWTVFSPPLPEQTWSLVEPTVALEAGRQCDCRSQGRGGQLAVKFMFFQARAAK